MSKSSSTAHFSLPGEYRKTAERLFPKDGFSKGFKPDLKAAQEFAKILGAGAEYQRALALDRDSNEMRAFLNQFKSNLDLLIQKTWVEKSEERRKDALHNDTSSFMVKLGKGDLPGALEDFGAILEELAYLFFGAQSKQADFTEYTFRIDAQIGLFWWYGNRLSSISKNNIDNIGNKNDAFLWSVLLLGICYLTNF